MRRAPVLVIGGALAVLGAAPASAADVTVQAVDSSLTWAPSQVSVKAGDTVTWSFTGTAQPHNVEDNTPNWSFVTPPRIAPPPASFKFDKPGTYGFVCIVHANTMVGTVTVTDATGTAPPPTQVPPGQTPFPNDSTPPTIVEIVDEQRPTLSRVRVSPVSRGARVRFRISEAARVTARFRRGGRTVKVRSYNARKGSRSFRVRGLRAGLYRVEVRARDLGGNRSRVRRTTVRVR